MFDTRDHASTAPGAALEPARQARANVEAARHAVLRRLAPALKHDMVVNLQAVSMMAETLNARLERSTRAGPDLQASVSKLNRLAREAVLTCLDVSTWIDPGEDDTAPLHEVVEGCVALMENSLNFRGFTLVNEVPHSEFLVCRSLLRNLLAASLLILSDTHAAPAHLQVTAEFSPGHALLQVSCVPSGDEAQRLEEMPAARVEWTDMQALAEEEGAELFRSPRLIGMRLARAVPSTPLRMVPI